MDFLRPEFEPSIEPFVEEGLVRVGPIAYTVSELLALSGEAAYKEAFDAWVWEESAPTRRQRSSEILELYTNERRFSELKLVIESGRAIPFVGSGMSAPTGLPTWGEFLREACKRTMGFGLEDLKACLAAGDYEDAASRIFDGMPPQLFNECFESAFTARPTQTIDGAVRLWPFLFESIVITTNFDPVLEQVYDSKEKPFQEILYGTAVGEFRRKCINGSRCLLKLHGQHDVAHGRVLMKSEYDSFYDPRSDGREELTLIFRRGGLLFLGCSLYQDRTMSLLKEIADADKNMPRHFALLRLPPQEMLIEREHFLAERNIFPIWYDGEHCADIEALLVRVMDDLSKL